MYPSSTADEGFDRLQRLLLAMRAGDEVRPSDAARLTGLSEALCRKVLERLEHAGFMAESTQDRFVRRTLDVMDS